MYTYKSVCVCLCLCLCVCNMCDLKGVEEHLVVHLDLPEEARDVCVWNGHEEHVVNPKQRHQDKCGLQQLPGTRGTPRSQL